MNGPTVLIVDDEPALAKALSINLRARHWNVITASDGTSALEATAKRPIDLAIIDLGLPDMDGIQVIEGIRGWSRMPIVVLSARHDSDEKVAALDAGADDYVTKPFGMDELLARLRANLRRSQTTDDTDGPIISAGTLQIDVAAKKVSRNGQPMRLTPTEWHFLEVLLRNQGRLVTHQQLLAEVWGPGYHTETNYLRLYSAQLRRKLEDDPARPQHIVTEPGIGYRFDH